MEKENLVWFNTIDEAIKYGLTELEITEKDILEQMEIDGEIFVFYKNPVTPVKDGIAVGVSNITQNKEKYAWYKADADFIIKYDDKSLSQVRWETTTHTGKRFNVYTGVAKEDTLTIETPKGIQSPNVDKDSKIYYLIEKAGE